MKKILLFLIFGLVFLGIFFQSFAQQKSSTQWISGRAVEVGTDIDAMREKAKANALSNAAQQAGISIEEATFWTVTETDKQITDSFTKIAEAKTKGEVIDLRNVKVIGPTAIADTLDAFQTKYKIEVQLEALVFTPHGEPDKSFKVELTTNRKTYKEYEPVILTITSTKDGFLTLFHIYYDTVSVLFPNAIDRNDTIKANQIFMFPPTGAYDFQLYVPPGKKSSEEIFIAVVTKEHIPFPNIKEIKIEGKKLKLKQELTKAYARWLCDIDVDKRASDKEVVRVEKEIKE